jgi:hypothetical protein
MNKCEKWLKEYLGSKSILCEVVRTEAKRKGFAAKELKDARKNLGVSTYHEFDRVGNATEEWYWSLVRRD